MDYRQLAALVVALVACDSDKQAPVPAGSSPIASSAAASAKLCGAAQSLAERLAPIDVEASRTAVDDAIALPESKRGQRTPQGAVVAFREDQWMVDGQPAATPAAVLGLLERRGTQVLLFAVDKNDQDLARVATLAEAAGEQARIHLLASPPGTQAAKPPAALAKELTGLGPSERATRLAQALSASIKDCSAATKLFSVLATEVPDARAGTLKARLPAAVHECDCKVGADVVELVAYVLEGDRMTVAKPLSLASDGKPIRLRGLKGQALYDALPDDGAPVKLER